MKKKLFSFNLYLLFMYFYTYLNFSAFKKWF